MTVAMKKQLDETLRDALLALYLNKVVPVDPTIKALQLTSSLKTPQDLYEYWLLDVLVSQDVPTTPVACATASLQQYINRLLMNMEPGYDSISIIPELVQTWRNEMHQYPTWAAHQKLLYFPATYLDPSLRNNKSDNFRQLENDLNQNRIQPDAVQTAVLAYLTRFEEVANLHILNGYIDGEDFANSTYYFIAKSRSESTYFWRSLNMAQRPLDGTPPQLPATPPKLDQPDPYAWSDWEKADVPIPDDAIEHSIRPVWFNNRLFIVWAECVHQDPAAHSSEGQTTKSNPLFRLNLCYRKHDGSWSTARTCLQGYGDDKSLHLSSIKKRIVTVAVQQHREDSHGLLFIALCAYKEDKDATCTDEPPYSFLKTVLIDRSLTHKPGLDVTQSAPNTEKNNSTLRVFAHGEDTNTIQHKIKQHTQKIAQQQIDTTHKDNHTWNFNGLQKHITNASTRYRPSALSLEFLSDRILTGLHLEQRTTKLHLTFSNLTLTLIIPTAPLPDTKFISLLNGSKITHELMTHSNTYELRINTFDKALVDTENSQRFTFDRENNISGKLFSVQALNHLINNYTYVGSRIKKSDLTKNYVNLVAVGPDPSFNAALDSITFKEPLNIEFFIFQPKGGSTTLSDDYDDMDIIKRWPADSLDNIRFRHTWDAEQPLCKGVTLFYGVAFTRVVDPVKPIVSALKAITLKFEPSTAPQIAQQENSNSDIAQWIDFSSSAIKNSDNAQQPRQSIRLNTAFAAELIRRTENSLDELFSRETQQLPEPPISGDTAHPMDFHGPYGRYFTELFLYLPWLIAHRLNTEHQYDEAERWIGYAFDPGRKQSDYWNAAPLSGPSVPSYSDQSPHDPHQIALSHPVHFRKALYFLYLDILINRGDAAYRELTPDSLGEAKLWYVRTLDLLGVRPAIQLIDQWSAHSLQNFSETTSESLRKFEVSLTHSSTNATLLIREGNSLTSLPAIDTPHLRLPFNPELLKRWDIAESRLYNLRHNLDIAGKPLHLPLFATPLDPRALLGANALGTSYGTASGLPDTQIPHYRFTVMHSQALSAVESVSQFGATLLSLIERKEQAQLQELQQQQAWDLANISVDLQTQALRIDRQNRQALLASKAIVQGRVSHYQQLLEKDVNEAETLASQLYLSSGTSEGVAAASQVAAGGMMMAPNIFGFSNGGSRWEGAMHAATALAQGSAIATRTAAAHLDRTAQFSRRREEWTLTRDQAQLELVQINAQLAHFAEQETATRLQLRLAETALSQTKANYDFLSKRFTKAQLYQWLNSQFVTLYYQAYDTTQALCITAEACWQYEIADFTTRFVQPGAWNTTYRGLGAGEPLKLSLLKMQAEYLRRNERELEIRKTVSLRQLKSKDNTSSINKEWTDIHTQLKGGSCEFELTHEMFDEDYKDQMHYLRRIKTISVSLPAILGPYENIRAILTQTYSKVVMSTSDKTQFKENLRASQQVALSTGIDDSGLFTLNFSDERYLPFEYTGAISKWRLSFPNHEAQKTLIESLTDIIVQVNYTARVGGGLS